MLYYTVRNIKISRTSLNNKTSILVRKIVFKLLRLPHTHTHTFLNFPCFSFNYFDTEKCYLLF